jgi:hypothetical protein
MPVSCKKNLNLKKFTDLIIFLLVVFYLVFTLSLSLVLVAGVKGLK